MAKVSIVVPIYNSENYLKYCLETIINQTYSNLEILLINDGSVDNSLEICREYEQKDNRIKLFNIPNSGVSVARNIGIKNATGEFITFVDSDDWMELNAIEFGVDKAMKTNADVIIWSYFKNYPNKEEELSLLPGGNKSFTNDKDLLFLKSIYQFYGEDRLLNAVSAGTTWGKFYKSNLIKDNNIKFKKELTRSQDVVFGLEAFNTAKLIKYYDIPLYHYRINNSSTCSGTRFIDDTKTPFNSLLDEMKSFSEQFKDKGKFEKVINARAVQVILWHLDHKYLHENYNRSFFEKRKQIITLINQQPYKDALKNVDMNLLPKKEKLVAILLRFNLVIPFYLIYKSHKKLTKRNNQKYN